MQPLRVGSCRVQFEKSNAADWSWRAQTRKTKVCEKGRKSGRRHVSGDRDAWGRIQGQVSGRGRAAEGINGRGCGECANVRAGSEKSGTGNGKVGRKIEEGEIAKINKFAK
ncbi:hypothetical protein D8M05_19655 [Oceanobacillus bengalensis]|uniref:Uncharacterized protein n=1 Tax=Oceanobacillus bengalensis TaxID=1435466 RepID=A0A494YR57_9BACI|nr:hypothetical protein D8M05_19655 [Oceanobacillus bengalensis]